ncbi:MAG: N-formylglutamate amidohydrolase [Candidatus Omnitrophota bacterium]
MPEYEPAILTGAPCGILFESPHLGREVPPELRHHLRLMEAAAQRLDGGIDFAGRYLLGAVGGQWTYSTVSRLVVDLNRGSAHVDSRICPQWPGACVYEDGGVIVPYAEIGGVKVRLYDDPLPEEEVNYRLEKYWRPYHERLRGIVDSSVQTYGQALLISLHSAYPWREHQREDRPAIYLGTRNGKTCGAAILSALRNGLEEKGFLAVAENYYQGAYTTQTYSEIDGLDAIQIELDRRYLLEESMPDAVFPHRETMLQALAAVLQTISLSSQRLSSGPARRLLSPRAYVDPATGDVFPF